MSYYYADLNEDGICDNVIKTPRRCEAPNRVRIKSLDTSLLGKKYNNGVWEDVPQPEPEPTDEEILQAEMLLNQQEILINQQSQDEVLAEILLGQQTM